jgi:hypothetical protein
MEIRSKNQNTQSLQLPTWVSSEKMFSIYEVSII